MTILKAEKTEANTMTSLYIAPVDKKALVNVTISGEAGSHAQIGIVPKDGTTVKQVSKVANAYTLKGEYPIGFCESRKYYPTGVVVEAASTTAIHLAEQRFYLCNPGSYSDNPVVMHLKTTNNRMIYAGPWSSADETTDPNPTEWIDDVAGNVFSEPEKVLVLRKGANQWAAMKTNGEIWYCNSATGNHLWVKNNSSMPAKMQEMANNPDDYTPMGCFGQSSYYCFQFHNKKTNNIIQIYTASISGIPSVSIDTSSYQPYSFRCNKGRNASNALHYTRMNSQTSWFYPNNYTGITSSYPSWSNSIAPLTNDANIRVVGMGQNSQFDSGGTGSYDFYVMLSTGETRATSGVASADYYSNSINDEELSADKVYDSVTFYKGAKVGSLAFPAHTNNYKKYTQKEVTKDVKEVVTYENCVPQADLNIGGDGFAAYRGILLGAGDEIKIFSESCLIVTVTGSEEVAA
jgi:hypothetical protein